MTLEEFREDLLTKISEMEDKQELTLKDIKATYYSNLIKASKSAKELEDKLTNIEKKKYDTDLSIPKLLDLQKDTPELRKFLAYTTEKKTRT